MQDKGKPCIMSMGLSATFRDLQGRDSSRLEDSKDRGQFPHGISLCALAKVTVVVFYHAGIPMSKLLGNEDQGQSFVD